MMTPTSAATLTYEARMGSKYADCPVCGGESTLICRKTALEKRDALEVNEWFDRRLKEGCSILCDGIHIDPINLLVRGHRICIRCLFVTSIQNEEELEWILTSGAIEALRTDEAKRLDVLRTILKTSPGEGSLSVLDLEGRLNRKTADRRIFTKHGRKHFENPQFRQALVKLCLQYLTTPDHAEVFTDVVSNVFTNGVQSLMEVVFALPIARELIMVTFDIDGASEVIKDGETGILVPAKDVEAMAAGIHKVLTEKEMAREMAKKGRQRVEKRFPVEIMVKRISELYHALLQEEKKRKESLP